MVQILISQILYSLRDIVIRAQEHNQKWNLCPHVTWQSALGSWAGDTVIEFALPQLPFFLFFHKSKSTVSIPALITPLTCTEPTANMVIIFPFYGWRKWAAERLNGVTISKEINSSQKLSGQGWNPLLLTQALSFCTCSLFPLCTCKKRLCLCNLALLQLCCHFEHWDHSHFAWTEQSWSQQMFIVWKHMPQVRARRSTRNGSSQRWLNSGHKVWLSITGQLFLQKNTLCPLRILQ